MKSLIEFLIYTILAILWYRNVYKNNGNNKTNCNDLFKNNVDLSTFETYNCINSNVTKQQYNSLNKGILEQQIYNKTYKSYVYTQDLIYDDEYNHQTFMDIKRVVVI